MQTYLVTDEDLQNLVHNCVQGLMVELIEKLQKRQDCKTASELLMREFTLYQLEKERAGSTVQ